MKIQFLVLIAALFICCCLGGAIASQSPGNERKANSATASSDGASMAPSPTKQNEFNWRGKVAAGGIIEIFGVKGDIRAEASAGNEIEVVAQKFGDRDEVNHVAVRVEETEGKVRICAAYPTLEGKGDAECLESLEWRSSEWKDGRELRLRYRDGKTQNIRLAEVQVQFKVRVPAGVRFIARTLRGDITASFGTANISSPIDLYTLGGNVSLEVPKAFNARVRLTTGGEISTDFPITVLGRFPGNVLGGNIGQGGTKISLRSEGGNVELRRASVAEGAKQVSVTEPQSVKSPQSMPTVDQILDRYVQAIGGATAHRKLTSRITKMTLVIEDSDATVSFENYAQAPNKGVQIGQVKLGNGIEFEISRGFNGTVGWSLNPTNGGFRELSGTELASDKRGAEFYSEIKLKELYPKMALLGQAPVGSHTAYCLEATPLEGNPLKMYFEAQSGLLVRIDSISESVKRGKVPEETYFEDYCEVDGIKLPFTIRMPADKYTYKVNEVKHNVPIDAAKFKSPSPADLSSALAAIEKEVELNRRNLEVPGAAIVIVKDDRVILLKGFGVRDVEKGLPVTPETLFGIGSCTKTFTALAAVISADEGKLSLDDSPKKFLPYFRLRDAEADANVTLRDLLSHRTGLEAHGNDDAWYGSERSREEVIRIGMQSSPTAKFREKGQYSNTMYIAAGEAIGKAQNATWEEVVASRIFKPLGMNASNCSRRMTQQAADFSWGYDDEGEKWKTFLNRDASAAAGAINTNAKDMGQWLRLLLGGGSIDGKRIVSEKGFQEMLTKLTGLEGDPYGLGLWEYDSKSPGTQRYGHGGGVDGFAAKFVFVPAQKLGFAILTNGYGAGAKLVGVTAMIVLGHLMLQP